MKSNPQEACCDTSSSVGRWFLLGAATLAAAALLSACAVTPPKGIQPITAFDLNRYLGKWYEIARIDHSFERGLVQTSAEYSRNDDGTVQVKNRGYNPEKATWKESIGKAKFLGAPTTAALKVSFFGPFYGGYNVVYLDESYENALVIGSNLDYFWLLSRSPAMDAEKYNALMMKAGAMGVDVSKVLKVPQGK
nr:lipocalin family protein [Comamonas testosteroni]